MKYSIILPVKNGGEYVKECVQSILAQTYADFNLHILENKSTDGTAEWLRTLQDDRIIVIPAEKPLSIEDNWARILSIRKNEFMTTIGHDDLLEKNYLQIMDNLIRQYPDASLYQTHFRFVDAVGNTIRQCKPMAESQTVVAFLSSVLQSDIEVNGTGFMLRSKDYDLLKGIPDYPNLLFADFELWIKATAISHKMTSPQNGFSYRLHQSTTAVSPDIKMQKAFERFIYFLAALKEQDPVCADVLNKYATGFVQVWCRGLAHRLLRTPKNKREDLSVAAFLKNCKHYVNLLSPDNAFDPLDVFSIKLAKGIDRYAATRNLFLLFKKIRSKPVLH